jgi:bifunctional ADP-heptose synthase (sugar kinase/adenylyltransferase)
MKGQPTLQKIVNRFPKVKILVVGDIMMDRFIWGKVSRISPEAPVPVVLVDNSDESETFGLGGAANVANNIHSLGGKVLLCGIDSNIYWELVRKNSIKYWRDLDRHDIFIIEEIR